MASEPRDSPPESTDDSDHDVRFSTPPIPYRRSNCVRLRLPGVDDPGERLATGRPLQLAALVRDVFDANAGIDLLELLTFPGSHHQEYVLCGHSGTPTADTTQQQLPDHGVAGTGTGTGARRVEGTIASRLADGLPESVGLESCSLRFRPVGVSPTPTSRLAIRENRTPTALGNLSYNPFRRTLRALDSEGHPYLFQTLLRQRSDGYTASVRLAVFDLTGTTPGYWRDEEFAREDHSYDLATVYAPAGFTSNFQAWQRSFHEPRPEFEKARQSDYSTTAHRDQRQAAKQLHAGTLEYWELLRGRDGYHEAYPDLVGYPKIPLRPADLANVVGAVPLYYDRDRWGPSVPRDAPRLVTQELIRAAAGTDQGHGDRTATTTADPAVMNVGGAEHQSLQSFAAQWFREQGHEVTEIAQDTVSRPDLRCATDEETLAVEIESKNTSKPANLLANVARAAARDRRVVLVVNAAEDARWAAEVVQAPFRRGSDTGTLLYNWTAPVRTDGGAVPVLPEGADTAQWWLDHDGDLRLEADNRTLAAGNAAAGVGSFEYGTPRFSPDENRLVVETAGGAPTAEYPSKAALTDDWTIVRTPHVPTRLSYLRSARIMYHDGTTLTEFGPTAEWDVAKNSRRYEGAVRAFLDRYTVAVEGTELGIDRFRERALAWYRRLTDREPPDRAWFGRSIPDHVERKRREEGGTERSFLADRTWRYPPGMESPDLPGVEAGDGDGDG